MVIEAVESSDSGETLTDDSIISKGKIRALQERENKIRKECVDMTR